MHSQQLNLLVLLVFHGRPLREWLVQVAILEANSIRKTDWPLLYIGTAINQRELIRPRIEWNLFQFIPVFHWTDLPFILAERQFEEIACLLLVFAVKILTEFQICIQLYLEMPQDSRLDIEVRNLVTSLSISNTGEFLFYQCLTESVIWISRIKKAILTLWPNGSWDQMDWPLMCYLL